MLENSRSLRNLFNFPIAKFWACCALDVLFTLILYSTSRQYILLVMVFTCACCGVYSYLRLREWHVIMVRRGYYLLRFCLFSDNEIFGLCIGWESGYVCAVCCWLQLPVLFDNLLNEETVWKEMCWCTVYYCEFVIVNWWAVSLWAIWELWSCVELQILKRRVNEMNWKVEVVLFNDF